MSFGRVPHVFLAVAFLALSQSSAIAAFSPPSSLTGTVVSSSQIRLTWRDNSTNESGFQIERATASNGPWSQITTAGANATGYSSMGLSAATTYYYRVRATGQNGAVSSYSNVASARTLAAGDTTAPSLPSGLTATAVSCGQINLAWAASTDTGSSGLKGYNVYRGGVFVKQVSAPATSTSDTGLVASIAYSYRVSAVDHANNQSAQSNTAMTNTPACMGGSGGGLVWDVTFGGLGSDIGQAAAVDSAGNVIVTGKFTGTVDLDGGPLTSAGGTDVFVAKYSAAGIHLWSKRFGGLGSDAGLAVAVDGSGNVVVTGSFQGTVSFGGGALTSAGGVDIFMAKYAGTTGVHLWSKRFGGSGSDAGLAVAVDNSGSVVVTGPFQGAVDFGGGVLLSAGLSDTFVAKYAATGTHLWSKRFGGSADDYGNAVAVDGSGDIVVTGYFSGTANFDGSLLTSAGLSDVFVAKCAGTTGAHLWSKRFGSSGYDAGNAVRVDGSGNVVVTGYFSGAVGFGGNLLTSAGGTDIFIAKYSVAGTHLWSQRFGGSVDDYAYGITVDGSANVVVTGAFQGTANFGGGSLLTSVGSYDIFVAKFSAVGLPLWSKRFGDLVSDKAYAVAADKISGDVVVTGFFLYQVNFGSGVWISAGSGDIFLVKFKP